MKKSVLKVAALLVAVIVSLTACSNTGKTSASSSKVDPKDVKMTIWTFYDAKTQGTQYIDTWTTIAQNHGYTIDFQNITPETYKTKIKVALAGSELPDIFSVWGGTYPDPFIQAGALLPVQKYLKSSGIDFKPNYTVKSKDGNNYLIPCQEESYASLFLNTALLSKIGQSAPKTWSDLMGIVTATNNYNKANGTKYVALGLGAKDRWVAEVLYTMIVNREDKDAFAKMQSKKSDMVSNPVYLDAAKKVQQLVDAGALPSGYMQMASAEANQTFMTGTYVMYAHQSSLLTLYAANMDKNSWDVAQFPDCGANDANFSKNLMNGNGSLMPGLVVNKTTKYPEIAAKYAIEFAKAVNEVNVTKFGNPGFINDSKLKAPADLAKPLVDYNNIVNSAKNYTPYYYAIASSNTGEAWRDLVQKLWAKGITPEDFVKQGKAIWDAEFK